MIYIILFIVFEVVSITYLYLIFYSLLGRNRNINTYLQHKYKDSLSIRKYTSSISESESTALFKKIQNIMETKELYRDSNLSLEFLSKQLSTNRTYISQIINENYKMNFYHFINEYRIEKVKRLIQSNRDNDYSIIEIAFEAGFNSKSTFNHVFKKIVGMTPSKYKKELSAL